MTQAAMFRPRPTQTILAAALLAVLAPHPFTAPPRGELPQTGAVEASTPDVGEVAPEPFPVLQRLKHLARLGLDRWHRSGHRGKGVKVAVLDSGFRGYREHLGKALPKKVAVRSFRDDRNLEARDSQHGILCGEVIHAVAPEAELLFANWEPDRPETFLDAARWARQQGAKVISCSVIMPSWSDGEGNGPVHEELRRILGDGENAGDLLCFASAGNIAQRHCAGTFRDGGKGLHEWRPGRTENLLTPWGDERVSVEVSWQEGAEYEVIVRDVTTGEVVGRDHRDDNGPRCAVVRFVPKGGRTYAVSLKLIGGKPAPFHLVSLGSALHYATEAGSVAFPADGPEVIAVGAVDADGQRAAYSSCGPNSTRPKPDLVAPVPFPSAWRPRPFAGTSAAAPQAAAMAAVLWSSRPRWKAERVRQTLSESTKDLGEPGHDCETGYGLAALPADGE
jgi:hypothetical protein